AAAAVSHRAGSFLQMVADTQRLLCRLTGARFVELFLGSGTLVNDVVAAQLKVLDGTGLILSNGEFGERLIDHAGRMGLDFDVLRVPWGSRYDLGKVERRLQEMPQVSWLWSTHCETSCGILNDLEGLTEICRRCAVKLCLDCTSSLGTVPVNLAEVFLASSVSGKGLASLSGIGLVFYNKAVETDSQIPRYLDLGYYRTKQGVPFTQSSNLVAALHQALLELEIPRRFEVIRRQHDLLRRELSAYGISAMAAAVSTAPAVLSIRLPREWSSLAWGDALERLGFLLSYRSEYLLKQNIIQICLMGKITDDQCRDLVATIAALAR
ncbi:MAG: aminotransferase class, partial [Deltaproteobacteria bacterium]|nr:aminotransferase class [Deltaproteobacteria bacterium]